MQREIAKLNLDIQRLSIKNNYLQIKRDNAIYKLSDALKYIANDNQKEAKRLINAAIKTLDTEG